MLRVNEHKRARISTRPIAIAAVLQQNYAAFTSPL